MYRELNLRVSFKTKDIRLRRFETKSDDGLCELIVNDLTLPFDDGGGLLGADETPCASVLLSVAVKQKRFAAFYEHLPRKENYERKRETRSKRCSGRAGIFGCN